MRGRIGRGSQEASELREAAQLGIAFDPIAGCTGANSDTPEILTHTLGKHFDIEQEKSRKYRRLTSVKHTGQGAASGLRGTCDRHTLRTEQALRARRIIQMAASQPSFLVVLCLILAALMGSARGQDAAAPAPAELQLGSPNLAPESAADAAAPAPAADMAASAPAPEAAEAPAPEADTEAPAPAPVEISAVTATAARRDGPPPNCVNEAFGLAGNNAPCQSLVSSFRSSLGSNPSMDDASLDAAVAKAGTISSSCCYVVRQFITDGCTCDSQLMNLLPMVGAQASQIQFVAKAAQRSSCAGSQYGGYFSNPCDGTASGGAAGRKLFMQAAPINV
ncbi:hypothetical protein CVIRNUC_006127 [Coccomyxa viridis]|uniref:Uncharacterized protein n=1 Tax=Coccomyxa viridis TaxID=1274662 RepID=A0AAV1I884_9CHLO|nr:hypothetical protein CVIRNUC_006127 [Coccomyxa viridis]